MNWANIKQKLLNFDTVRGLILLPLGISIALVAYYAEQHVILTACIGVGVFLAVEGLKKILSNPVKASVALDLAKAKYWAESELGFDPTGVTQPPATTQVSPATPATPQV